MVPGRWHTVEQARFTLDNRFLLASLRVLVESRILQDTRPCNVVRVGLPVLGLWGRLRERVP
jgi:hypothetical protein